MRDDYKLIGGVKEIKVNVEDEVALQLSSMEQYSGITQSELINTALKRFISQHKDFLPPTPGKK